MGKETQYDIPAKPNADRHELPFLYRDKDEVEQHDPWPDHPSGGQDHEYLGPPYGCYFGKGVDAEPVGPDDEDGEKGDHADCLVEHQFCYDAWPSNACACGPQGFQELCRGALCAHATLLIIVLFLGFGRCRRLGWERVAAWEEPLEEDVPAVTELCLEKAVDGKLKDTLAVDGLGNRVLGVPA